MADDKKISDLTVATAPTGVELIEIVQGGVNKQTTTQDIADLADPSSKQDLVNAAVALTSASTIDITAIKHTLTTAEVAITFTISYTGDDISIRVILNATSSTFTFPAGALCISEGVASGNNTAGLAGVSGDKYVITIKHWGSGEYTVVVKNEGQ